MKAYNTLRMLSIDVAFGALAGGFMAAEYLKQSMGWAWYLVLPMAVWVIYTGDHLLDANRMGASASTDRHRFHHSNFKILVFLATFGAIGCVALAFLFFSNVGLLFGLTMGGLVSMHLLIVRWVGEHTSLWLVKEFGVAFIYAVGIWGLPLIQAEAFREVFSMIPVVQYFLLAFVNLLEFSLFEIQLDAQDGSSSFVRALGKAKSIRMIRVILGIVAMLGLVLLLVEDRIEIVQIELILGFMAAMLGLLLYRKAWFSQHERYRTWGDAAFLVPFLYLPMAWL